MTTQRIPPGGGRFGGVVIPADRFQIIEMAARRAPTFAAMARALRQAGIQQRDAVFREIRNLGLDRAARAPRLRSVAFNARPGPATVTRVPRLLKTRKVFTGFVQLQEGTFRGSSRIWVKFGSNEDLTVQDILDGIMERLEAVVEKYELDIGDPQLESVEESSLP